MERIRIYLDNDEERNNVQTVVDGIFIVLDEVNTIEVEVHPRSLVIFTRASSTSVRE